MRSPASRAAWTTRGSAGCRRCPSEARPTTRLLSAGRADARDTAVHRHAAASRGADGLVHGLRHALEARGPAGARRAGPPGPGRPDRLVQPGNPGPRPPQAHGGGDLGGLPAAGGAARGQRDDAAAGPAVLVARDGPGAQAAGPAARQRDRHAARCGVARAAAERVVCNHQTELVKTREMITMTYYPAGYHTVGGIKFEVYVDDRGWFRADDEGFTETHAETRQKLEANLKVKVSQAKVRVEIPFVKMTNMGGVRGKATGIDARTGG